MKQWSVSFIFNRYEIRHQASGGVLTHTMTNLNSQIVNAKTEEEAFGIAYYSAKKTNKDKELFSHLVVEIPKVIRIKKTI